MTLKNPSFSIILASSSPRRRELLEQLGWRFEILRPEVTEKRKGGESGPAMVRRLSQEKAVWVAKSLSQNASSTGQCRVVIAADTTVLAPNGVVLEKPRDEKDAVRMLALLQGKTHVVATGVTVMMEKRRRGEEVMWVKKTRVVRTRVTFRRLSRDEILAYVAGGEPMDKAGAYAAQGVGATLIASVRGSYTNVIGLPMAELVELVERARKDLGAKKRK